MSAAESREILSNDPVIRDLLQSREMAQLAYSWKDGTPRVVPMWFHWTGEEFIMGAPPNSPKMKVLDANPSVAFSINTDEFPYTVLSVRGTASTTLVDEPFPEYASMARRYLGEDGANQFIDFVRQTFDGWVRIVIRPEQVRVLDFKTRFPSAWSR